MVDDSPRERLWCCHYFSGPLSDWRFVARSRSRRSARPIDSLMVLCDHIHITFVDFVTSAWLSVIEDKGCRLCAFKISASVLASTTALA